MRILFLSTSMGMGGADSQLLAAAQGLRARGHDILIVSSHVARSAWGCERGASASRPSHSRCHVAFRILEAWRA